MMNDLVKIIADSLREMTFVETKPVQGRPRLIGKTEDGLTVVELIGPREKIERIAIMGALAPDALDAARRTGAMMAHMLDLVCPMWKDRQKWLLHAMKISQVRQELHQMKTLGSVVSLKYNKKSGILGMNIRIRG